VDCFAVHGVIGFHSGFAEGGVGVYRVAQFPRGQSGADGDSGLRDQFRSVRFEGSTLHS
jgi:hypothetical protein